MIARVDEPGVDEPGVNGPGVDEPGVDDIFNLQISECVCFSTIRNHSERKSGRSGQRLAEHRFCEFHIDPVWKPLLFNPF